MGVGMTGATAGALVGSGVFASPASADANGCVPVFSNAKDCLNVYGNGTFVHDVRMDSFRGLPAAIGSKMCNYQAHWWGVTPGKNNVNVTWDFYSDEARTCSTSLNAGRGVWMDKLIMVSGFIPNTKFCGQTRESDISMDMAKWKTVFPCIWIEA
jgi:hypothetical protein